MTRIAVFSDTHGHINSCIDIINAISPDYIIHCGDICRDVNDLRAIFDDIEIYDVLGNNDYAFVPKDRVVEIDGFKIFVTHGHMYGVKVTYERILNHAKSVGADVCVFGHTHLAIDEERDGIRLLNPGSLTLPFGKPPSYAVIEIEDKKLRTSVIYLNNWI